MQPSQSLTSFREPGSRKRLFARVLMAAGVAALLAGCQADELGYGPKASRPADRETRQMMAKLGMSETAPILVRIFKEENALEVWKKDRTGRYALLKSYEICKWSGKLGPKIKEGDRQAPEGFYTITPAQMNPNSSYYLSFNTGYPNAFDRSHGRTGTHLMVHGACSSAGCYAMTDAQIQEIYALARDAFRGGQRAFQLQAFPFRLTPENLARHRNDPNMPFWKMLKEGYDHFELTRTEPKVDVCGRQYVFNATTNEPLSPVAACPDLKVPQELQLALAARRQADEAKTIEIAARLETEARVAAEKAQRKAEYETLLAQRAAEREERLANRQPLLGTVMSAFASTPAPAPVALAADPVVGPDGTPLPKVDPRGPATAVAAAPAAAAPAAQAAASATIPGSTAPAPAAAVAAAPVAGDVATTAAIGQQPADPAAPPTTLAAAEPPPANDSYIGAVTRLIPWF